MLRLIKQNTTGLKYPLYASLTLSFASFGDAFLYPFLPQYADVMQIPVVWIGVLLSINRFIRIVFNQYVVRLFAMYGVRPVTIAASVMAIVVNRWLWFGMGIDFVDRIQAFMGYGFCYFTYQHTGLCFRTRVYRDINGCWQKCPGSGANVGVMVRSCVVR